MKNLIFVTVLIGSFISCSLNKGIEPENLEENIDIEKYSHKWELIEMSGNIANMPTATGSAMEWQEYYILNLDSTFTKSRKRDNIVKEESGTYVFLTLSDGKYLELSYNSDNDLIGNCTSESKELLKLNSDNTMIGTWWACDGPGLIYKKIE